MSGDGTLLLGSVGGPRVRAAVARPKYTFRASEVKSMLPYCITCDRFVCFLPSAKQRNSVAGAESSHNHLTISYWSCSVWSVPISSMLSIQFTEYRSPRHVPMFWPPTTSSGGHHVPQLLSSAFDAVVT